MVASGEAEEGCRTLRIRWYEDQWTELNLLVCCRVKPYACRCCSICIRAHQVHSTCLENKIFNSKYIPPGNVKRMCEELILQAVFLQPAANETCCQQQHTRSVAPGNLS